MTDPALPAASPPIRALPPHLQGLNRPQREAVEVTEGPVLVLAGAGTGKTRVLTRRLAHLLVTGRARPWQILAVTFTNKAARELRDRVAQLLGEPVEGWWLGTFHSLSARLLRRHAELAGLTPAFTILDQDDQLRLVRQVMEAAEIDHRKWPPRLIHGAIERWKDRALSPDQLKAEDAGDLAGGRLIELYVGYQERLRTLNCCDFGDLLLHVIRLFQDHPDILAQYHRRLRYLLVDEYQDTNVAQYLWLRLLAQGHRNLCCVGDDDQSIYGWRGAEVGNILRFESDFPGARLIRLEENYRSTGNILAAAGALIAHNRGRLGKTLWTQDAPGPPLTVRACWDGGSEARWVAETAADLHRQGVPWAGMAVLVRAGHQSREFEDAFLEEAIPHRLVGGVRFYERQEIRDAVAYLRVTVQPADDLALARIINTPKRGIGERTVADLTARARAGGISLIEACRRALPELKPRLRTALGALMRDFERWQAALATTPAAELVRVILDESGYTGHWQADKTGEGRDRLDNLKALVDAVAEFGSLPEFLEHVSLVAEAQEGAAGDEVSLMTLHAAKGLEFDVVFLPGWEEGLFPNQRALDESGIAGLEEERRLAYVGLTRARRQALVSHAGNRRVFGSFQTAMPSRFVEELPPAHVAAESEPGLELGTTLAGDGSGLFRGWQASARQAAGLHGMKHAIIEGEVLKVTPRERPAQPLGPGARVFHQKFGYGTVAAVDADKLEVDFDHSGRKRLLDSFVTPA